jgi:PAS domain S-box-containing protein
LLSPDGTLLEANDTGLNFCGVTAADVIGKPFWETPWWTYSEEQRQNLREGIATAAAGELVRFEVSYLHEKGKLFILDFSLKPVLDDQGNVTQMIAEGRDITDLKKMDKDLRQSQKMEAIGTLAGGIAHDFNNILTAIIGYTDMAQRKLTNIDPIARDLERAQEASNRAKELVSRILAFSRQAEQERKPLQMTTVIDEVFKLLRATLPTSIEIQQQFDTPLNGDMVLADSTQLHQVLMNLGTNAAQAMRASGGIITVSLTNIDVDTSLITLYPELTPGPYMRLTFSDNGHGMDAAVKERIFEPYFTTKKVGEGTGMGLSVVQGIIKSHGGTIGVYSEPGHGTTFNIFLPRASGEHLHDTPAETSVIGGSERILFVDDEEMLTELGQELLQALGYQVAAGTSSLEMLEHFRAQPDAFDLVITDMTMPGLTGRELAKELRAIRSDIPIVMCSGFTEFLSVAEVAEAGISEFMMKPYVARTLDQVIRRVLAP